MCATRLPFLPAERIVFFFIFKLYFDFNPSKKKSCCRSYQNEELGHRFDDGKKRKENDQKKAAEASVVVI